MIPFKFGILLSLIIINN